MLKKFTNCRLVKGGKLVRDDLWVRKVRPHLSVRTKQFYILKSVLINTVMNEYEFHFLSLKGVILDPEKIYFDEKAVADLVVDCGNAIIAPGFIDIQVSQVHANTEQGCFELPHIRSFS